MENQTKEVCSGRVIYDNWGHSAHCQHKVTAHEDGEPWCTIHAPSYRARKRAERQAQYDAKWAGIREQDARNHRNQARLALYPELVKALREAHEALHQCHPSQERIPVGKGICEWGPCARLRTIIAEAQAIEKEAKG